MERLTVDTWNGIATALVRCGSNASGECISRRLMDESAWIDGHEILSRATDGLAFKVCDIEFPSEEIETNYREDFSYNGQ